MTLEAGALERWLSASGSAVAPTETCTRMARQLPLVHRTGGRACPPWTQVFDKGVLTRARAGSEAERTHGHDPVVYFFLGAGAFPRGLVALVLRADVLTGRDATFTPFDTGGVGGGWMVRADGAALSEAEAHAFYVDHHANHRDLADFAPSWIASLFADPLDYVRRSLVSAPDRASAHGLRSRTGYRLAWTIELQCLEDVPIRPGVERVVVGRRALALDLPDTFLGQVVFADEDTLDTDFDQHIARAILSMIEVPP